MGRSCSSFGYLKKRGGVGGGGGRGGGRGGGIYTTNQKAPPNMKRCSCCKVINALDSRLGLLPIADRANNIRAGWYSSLKIFQRLLRGFSILGFQYWPKLQADCKQPDADINYLFVFDCLQESWDARERRWRV